MLTVEFPVRKTSNEENVSIWWRHHVSVIPGMCYKTFNVLLEFGQLHLRILPGIDLGLKYLF